MARLLREILEAQLGPGSVVQGVDAVRAAEDVRRACEEMLRRCHVLLVVIGPGWLTAPDDSGCPGLRSGSDCVRSAIRAAVEVGLDVMPVHLDRAWPVRQQDLPADIVAMANRAPHLLRHDSIDIDLQSLLDDITHVLPEHRQPAKSRAIAEAVPPDILSDLVEALRSSGDQSR